MSQQQDLSHLNTALIGDAAQRLWGAARLPALIASGLHRRTGKGFAYGPAYTIRVSKAENPDGSERQRWFSVLDAVPAGAVVVIQVVGDVGGATIGDVVANRLTFRGAAGAVIDGPARDADGIEAFGFPVWSRELTPRGMVPSTATTEAGIAVEIGGLVVRPGDLVAADTDGVVVVPREDAGRVAGVALQFAESEARTHALLREGASLFDAYKSKDSIPLKTDEVQP